MFSFFQGVAKLGFDPWLLILPTKFTTTETGDVFVKKTLCFDLQVDF
jgi:hypothetical protein